MSGGLAGSFRRVLERRRDELDSAKPETDELDVSWPLERDDPPQELAHGERFDSPPTVAR